MNFFEFLSFLNFIHFCRFYFIHFFNFIRFLNLDRFFNLIEIFNFDHFFNLIRFFNFVFFCSYTKVVSRGLMIAILFSDSFFSFSDIRNGLLDLPLQVDWKINLKIIYNSYLPTLFIFCDFTYFHPFITLTLEF